MGREFDIELPDDFAVEDRKDCDDIDDGGFPDIGYGSDEMDIDGNSHIVFVIDVKLRESTRASL